MKGFPMKNTISRRRFLEQSMFAAAAAGAAAFGAETLHSRSLAAQENEEKKVGPNDQIGVLLVGLGGRGGSHANQWGSHPETKVLYICDADERIGNAKCDMFEQRFDYRPKFVRDMREAMEDKNLTIMSCATTNHWHALSGIWAIQHGLHCYIEKPVSFNIHEGRALCAAAEKYNKCIQTGTQCRSMPANIDAEKFIRDGGIGDVNFSRGLCYKRRAAIGPKGEYTVPESVDYNLWSGPAQMTPPTRPNFHYDWHWQRLYGNGDLGNQGPHQTDIARWHLGIEHHPNAIMTYGGRLGYDVEKNDPNYVDAGDTANTETTIFDYGDKCIVFEVRGLPTPDLRGAKIGVITYGSKGYVVQSEYNYTAAFDLEGNIIEEFKGGGDSMHYNNFLEAIKQNDRKLLTANERCGHLSAGMSHLGNISYYLGEDNKIPMASVEETKKTLQGIKSLDDNVDAFDRMVEHLTANGVDLQKTPISMGPLLKFDPEKEVFIGNAKANELLTRDYRDGFVVPDADKV